VPQLRRSIQNFRLAVIHVIAAVMFFGTNKEAPMLAETFKELKTVTENAKGRVMPPLLLYFFGVPGFLCILLWLFFFRGK
jgi:hypothetical protein